MTDKMTPNPDFKYAHIRDERGRLLATIGTSLDHATDTVKVSAAIVHNNDLLRANKKKGKFLCSIRLETNHYKVMDYQEFKERFKSGTLLECFANDYVLRKKGWLRQ